VTDPSARHVSWHSVGLLEALPRKSSIVGGRALGKPNARSTSHCDPGGLSRRYQVPIVALAAGVQFFDCNWWDDHSIDAVRLLWRFDSGDVGYHTTLTNSQGVTSILALPSGGIAGAGATALCIQPIHFSLYDVVIGSSGLMMNTACYLGKLSFHAVLP